MSYNFSACRIGEHFVDVVLATSRREFSPVMTLRNEEEVICGISAGALALFGAGEIKTIHGQNGCAMRILPEQSIHLV